MVEQSIRDATRGRKLGPSRFLTAFWIAVPALILTPVTAMVAASVAVLLVTVPAVLLILTWTCAWLYAAVVGDIV